MKPVLGLAALLVAALIGLAVWLAIGGREERTAAPTASREQREFPERFSPPSSTPDAPAVDAGAPRDARSTSWPDGRPRTYAVGDVIVHDRRRDGGPMVSPDRTFTPPEGRMISSEVAQRVTTAVEPAAQRCMETLPESSRTAQTKLGVTMTVQVKSGSLTVSDVAAQVAGLDESVMAPTLECLRKQMAGTVVDAAGQPDIPSYFVTTYYTAR
jgi:hypothetical protein